MKWNPAGAGGCKGCSEGPGVTPAEEKIAQKELSSHLNREKYEHLGHESLAHSSLDGTGLSTLVATFGGGLGVKRDSHTQEFPAQREGAPRGTRRL